MCGKANSDNSLLSFTEFKGKKVVLVSVPGAFTPTCQNQHITGFIAKLEDLKKAGVDQIVVVRSLACP